MMFRAAYSVAIVGLSWLLMQAVHEAGHVITAWGIGGTVQRVVLHPATISRTDVAANPHPLAVTWGGPLFGATVPLLGAWLLRESNPHVRHAVRFFAGFCLIANGAYLAYGSMNCIGDAGELLSQGTPAAALWLFGAITITAGLLIWHRLGHRLGFAAVSIERPHALIAWSALIILMFAECVLSPR